MSPEELCKQSIRHLGGIGARARSQLAALVTQSCLRETHKCPRVPGRSNCMATKFAWILLQPFSSLCLDDWLVGRNFPSIRRISGQLSGGLADSCRRVSDRINSLELATKWLLNFPYRSTSPLLIFHFIYGLREAFRFNPSSCRLVLAHEISQRSPTSSFSRRILFPSAGISWPLFSFHHQSILMGARGQAMVRVCHELLNDLSNQACGHLSLLRTLSVSRLVLGSDLF